jgi:hypothetical protein
MLKYFLENFLENKSGDLPRNREPPDQIRRVGNFGTPIPSPWRKSKVNPPPAPFE